MAFEIICSLLVHRKAFRACHKSWRRRAREVCAGGGPVGREGAGLDAAPGERGGGEEPPLAGQLDQGEGEDQPDPLPGGPAFRVRPCPMHACLALATDSALAGQLKRKYG